LAAASAEPLLPGLFQPRPQRLSSPAQVTTLLIAQLGTLAISASSAVAAATQVASAGLSAAFTACASIRVGYHLGRGDVRASQAAMWIVAAASAASTVLLVCVLWPLREPLVALVTSDEAVVPVAAELVAAAFVAAGLSQLVSIGTSGGCLPPLPLPPSLPARLASLLVPQPLLVPPSRSSLPSLPFPLCSGPTLKNDRSPPSASRPPDG